MKIIDRHSSVFEIAIPKKSDTSLRAAEILRNYIYEVTECSLPISEKICEKCLKNKIILDVEPFSFYTASYPDLGEEGFIITETDGTVFILASTDASLIYACYEFLEKYFGCLWLTSSEDHIPHMCSAEIPDGAFEVYTPALNYREVFYRDSWDPSFAEKHKLNGQFSYVKDKKIFEGHKNWGFWCHSFFRLVPPEEYFNDHPEYFSLVDGKRINDGQLCCTNDEMIAVAIKNLKKFMDEKPEAKYWSVSQNDTARFCTCDKCKKLDEEAGSHIGSIMYFVNKVAETFPNKIISTLSYWYSRTAPKKIEMRDNVHIMLCNIECDRSKPIPQNPQCESFVKDLAVWHNYCGNIFLWDYDIQFANLISPFPNFRILGPNMKFFYENNVRSIFNQGNREKNGDFWALRSYLLAKLSWDPYTDTEKVKHDFISAYYGAAAPYIEKYLDIMADELEKTGEPLSIFGQPQDEKFLSKEMIPVYLGCFSDAENAVRDNKKYLSHVEEDKLGLVYAILKAKLYGSEEEKNGYIAFFRRVANETGLEKVEEWKITVDMFLDSLIGAE
ncbi:MAG: DUF4838 domain-containing protein [Clostridia bacterium]|nr:DUF4838 domain-containing protein [Clostridia bacterium]